MYDLLLRMEIEIKLQTNLGHQNMQELKMEKLIMILPGKTGLEKNGVYL